MFASTYQQSQLSNNSFFEGVFSESLEDKVRNGEGKIKADREEENTDKEERLKSQTGCNKVRGN